MDHLDHRDRRDLEDYLAVQAVKDLAEQQDHQVQWGCLDLLDFLEQEDSQVVLDPKVPLASRA